MLFRSKELTMFEFDYSTYVGTQKEYEAFTTKELDNGLLELLQSLKSNNNQLLDIRIKHPTLEEKFIDIAKEVIE